MTYCIKVHHQTVLRDFCCVCEAHPTYSEVLVNLFHIYKSGLLLHKQRYSSITLHTQFDVIVH